MSYCSVLQERNVMRVYDLLQSLYSRETRLREAFIKTAEYHKTEPDIYYECQANASLSDDSIRNIKLMMEKYLPIDEKAGLSGNSFHYDLVENETGLDLLADLRYMWLVSRDIELYTHVLLQSAAALGDHALENASGNMELITLKQSQWLLERISREVARLLPVAG